MARATTKATVRRARALRRTMTLPEVLLWQRLRGQPCGVKFREQHPVGDYVADFYAPLTKMIFEVDGLAHDLGDRPERDSLRDAWLVARGFRVVRIAARDVLADAVVRMVLAVRV
jgi:very-short-patch-repair endonuclease